MSKMITLCMATMGLAGCGAVEVTSEAVLHPTEAAVESFRNLFQWLGQLATIFFNAIFQMFF